MRSVRIAFFLLLIAIPAPAGDDIEAVSALWTDFVSALRRGDYPRAYALFSPESRAAMPYDGFVAEYGPLGTALEMVLAKPESRSTRLDGEWAELTYGGYRPGTGRPFRVAVAAVRNQGAWALVAGRNEARERTEALARTLLLALSGLKGLPDAKALAADMIANAEASRQELRQYRFDFDEDAIKALPLQKGLRAFHVDAWGRVRPGEQSSPDSRPPEQSASTPPQGQGMRALGPIPELGESAAPLLIPAARAPVLVDGLPEMAEPPPPGTGKANAAPEDMPELPAPPPFFDNPGMPPSAPPRILEPELFDLPEIIG